MLCCSISVVPSIEQFSQNTLSCIFSSLLRARRVFNAGSEEVEGGDVVRKWWDITKGGRTRKLFLNGTPKTGARVGDSVRSL